jgi:hypothetical protein
MDPGSTGYRVPPVAWRRIFSEYARRRGGELLELARQLDLEDAAQ